MTIAPALAVGLAGAAGAVARYLVAAAVPADGSLPGSVTLPLGDRLPWGQLTVNVGGSFLLGLVAFGLADGPTATALATGFCGAFTTFSSFGVATVDRMTAGDWPAAAALAGGTLALALPALWLGRWLVT